MTEEELLAKIIVKIINRNHHELTEGNKRFIVKHILEAWREKDGSE